MSTLLKTLLTDASVRDRDTAKNTALLAEAFEPWQSETY
jgi:hypothetical protein